MPSESESPALQNSLLSPLLTGTESPFDLEQQWQDLMSIMEMQVGLSEKRSLQALCRVSQLVVTAPPREGDSLRWLVSSKVRTLEG